MNCYLIQCVHSRSAFEALIGYEIVDGDAGKDRWSVIREGGCALCPLAGALYMEDPSGDTWRRKVPVFCFTYAALGELSETEIMMRENVSLAAFKIINEFAKAEIAINKNK